MLFSLLLFGANWFIGKSIVEFFGLDLKQISHIFSLVLGTALNTLVIFISALIFGLNPITIIGSSVLLMLIASLILLKKGFNLEFPRINFKKSILEISFFLLFLIFIVVFFTRSIYQTGMQITAGNRLVWTDWPIHIALMSSFSKGDNFPPQNPQYANQSISYPFFSDFFSAVLNVAGANIKTSLVLPGIILTFSTICLLYYLGRLLTSSSKISMLGVLIGVLWGGLGFLYSVNNAVNSNNLIKNLINPPIEYTFYQEKNLWFFTFLYSEMLPQRAFLFGLPLTLISLILILLGIKHDKKNYLLLAGYIIGLMPFFHMHSLLSIILLLTTLLPLFLIDTDSKNLLKKFKSRFIHIALFLILPISGLLLIQYPILRLVDLNQTIGFNFGWMKQNENFLVFWFKNTGLFWPLLAASIYFVRKNQILLSLLISISIVFIIANFIRFAPWPYDNLKVLTYWYLIGAFYVALVISKIAKISLSYKIVSLIIVFSLIASGTLELIKSLNSNNEIIMWQSSDFEISRLIEETTEPRALVLAAAYHNHPSTTLAGRRAIIGFPGNAWSWGYKDWYERESDVRKIYQAYNEIETLRILKKRNINYVLISDIERSFEPGINEEFFEKNLELVGAGERMKIFRVL